MRFIVSKVFYLIGISAIYGLPRATASHMELAMGAPAESSVGVKFGDMFEQVFRITNRLDWVYVIEDFRGYLDDWEIYSQEISPDGGELKLRPIIDVFERDHALGDALIRVMTTKVSEIAASILSGYGGDCSSSSPEGFLARIALFIGHWKRQTHLITPEQSEAMSFTDLDRFLATVFLDGLNIHSMACMDAYLISYILLFPVDKRGVDEYCSTLMAYSFEVTQLMGLEERNVADGEFHLVDWQLIGETVMAYCPTLLSPHSKRDILVRTLKRYLVNPIVIDTRGHPNTFLQARALFGDLEAPLIAVSDLNVVGEAEDTKYAWFQYIALELLNPLRGLFEKTFTGSNIYKPSWNNGIPPTREHIADLEFAGTFVAKALLEKQPLPIRFTQYFYKGILGSAQHIDELQEYVAEARPLQYQLLRNLSDGERVPEGLTFTTFRVARDGQFVQVDVVPGGSTIIVTNENQHQYVHDVIHHLSVQSIEPQMDAFIRGFIRILHPLRIAPYTFTPYDLDMLVSPVFTAKGARSMRR